MIENEPRQPTVLRDQQRALYAYQVVSMVPQELQKDYSNAVNRLGTNILQSGLCAAIASVQRLKGRGTLLLEHLASAGVAGLDGAQAGDLAKRIRELDTDAYMIATREILAVTSWLKRGVQATFGET